jgi:hypothetical protein
MLTPLTSVGTQFGRVSFRTTESNPNNPDNHPRLTIEYNVPEPGTCLILGLGLLTVFSMRRLGRFRN